MSNLHAQLKIKIKNVQIQDIIHVYLFSRPSYQTQGCSSTKLKRSRHIFSKFYFAHLTYYTDDQKSETASDQNVVLLLVKPREMAKKSVRI